MIKDYLKAGYPVLWVQTPEPDRFVRAAMKETEDCGRTGFIWDCVRGYRKLGNGEAWSGIDEAESFAIPEIAAKAPAPAVFFLMNFHFFLAEGHQDRNSIIQGIQNYLDIYKARGITLIMVGPEAQAPAELRRDIVTLDFPLPDREALRGILAGIKEEVAPQGITLEAAAEEKVLDSATGLTWQEAESAFSLALVRKKAFDPQTISELKGQMVQNTAALKLSHYQESFSTLIGNDRMKAFAMNRYMRRRAGVPFKGLIILGPPGTGKSHFAKALANEWGWACLDFQIDKVMGELYGQAEGRMRDAFRVIRAMAPVVVFIDEIEKGLSGIGSQGHEATQRVGMIFLTEMEALPPDVFIVATCNNYEALAAASGGAFVRAGRWDATFFVDLPGPQEREKILALYLGEFMGPESRIDPKETRAIAIQAEGYSGAEMRQIAIESYYNGGDLQAAASFVIPISRSQKAQIEGLREWSKLRTQAASESISQEVGGRRTLQID